MGIKQDPKCNYCGEPVFFREYQNHIKSCIDYSKFLSYQTYQNFVNDGSKMAPQMKNDSKSAKITVILNYLVLRDNFQIVFSIYIPGLII